MAAPKRSVRINKAIPLKVPPPPKALPMAQIKPQIKVVPAVKPPRTPPGNQRKRL